MLFTTRIYFMLLIVSTMRYNEENVSAKGKFDSGVSSKVIVYTMRYNEENVTTIGKFDSGVSSMVL